MLKKRGAMASGSVPRDGVAAREVQLVGHDAEVADTKGLVDGAGGVGGDKRCRPEPGHEPHGEGDLLSGIALVAVKAPLHGEHALAAQLAGHEAPHVPVAVDTPMPAPRRRG